MMFHIVLLFVLILSGCTSTYETPTVKRTTRRISLGGNMTTLSGFCIGDVFVSEDRFSLRQMSQLWEPIASDDDIPVYDIPHPFEGVTWLDAMSYCDAVQSTSLAAGFLGPGEIVRLPTIRELARITREEGVALWYFDGVISNGVPPAADAIAPVYEWTCEISETDPLSFLCLRHDPVGTGNVHLKPFNPCHAYANMAMRLVIAPKDETFVRNRSIASECADAIWKLTNKQRYRMSPFREAEKTGHEP